MYTHTRAHGMQEEESYALKLLDAAESGDEATIRSLLSMPDVKSFINATDEVITWSMCVRETECVCVCEREREREKDRETIMERERERESERQRVRQRRIFIYM
jgi:hypothetical protein